MSASSQRDSVELVGESAPMCALRAAIARVAPLGSTVLLSGETGVGKGLVARELHRQSPRRAAPLVHVDCAALAPTLVESELFGHECGAFTGAVATRAGRFERAARGTIFLDEIGDLEPRLQAKLLRVLQDREFERLGGSRTLPMTARVVAASSRDLGRDVLDGRFRADLYYRLNVVQIVIPPLRERSSDVPLLLAATLRRLSRVLSLSSPELAPNAIVRLIAHSWRGNVRELHNVAERLLIHFPGRRVEATDVAEVLDAPFAAGNPDRGAPAWREAGIERLLAPEDPSQRIAAELRATGGNVAHAARRLGLPRSTLRRWIRRYHLD
jgi:transcriptional regulator with GAF, ATPase, and Fis domain